MVNRQKLLTHSPEFVPDKESTTFVVAKRRSFMSDESGPLPVKYCKYHLFGRCKASQCHHTHDIVKAEVLSCRKMNASNQDIDRMIDIIKDNPQV